MTADDRHLFGDPEPPPVFPASADGGRLKSPAFPRPESAAAAAADALQAGAAAAQPIPALPDDPAERAAQVPAPGQVAARPHSEIAAADSPQSLLSAIVAMASSPALDVAKFDALLQMQERMEKRQAEIAFIQALAELPAIRVKKNGRVNLIRKDGTDGGSYPFARWEDIDTIIGPLLRERGFRLTFDAQPRQGDGGGLVVTGTLLHRDGHSRSASMPLALDTGAGRNNLQAMGSTLSYGKRYCAEMLLNIVREGEDNDASDADPISDQECAELSRGVTETGLNLNAFLALFGVTAIPDIQRKDLATARNAINLKRKGRQA